MRMLLDECIDSAKPTLRERGFAREFVDYEIKTVPQMGWAGIKDGQLLVLAAAEVDIFITVDRNLSFQQNVLQFDIAVIVLEAPLNRLADLQPLAPKILAILGEAAKGQSILVIA